MLDVRCRCGKIVCQLDGPTLLPQVVQRTAGGAGGEAAAADSGYPDRTGIAIRCRHCKAYVILEVPVVRFIHFSGWPDARPGPEPPPRSAGPTRSEPVIRR